MKIGILGTGRVGQTLAQSWAAVGHEASFGSRNPGSITDLGFPVKPSAAVVADNEVVVNATPGSASLELVNAIGADVFAGKILIDVANANTPSFDLVYPNSSLGERLQEALPAAKVVKTMNTAAMTVLTEPSLLAPSSVFSQVTMPRQRGSWRRCSRTWVGHKMRSWTSAVSVLRAVPSTTS